MLNQTFKNLYKGLNPEQKLAVDTIEGPVMVIAGPGTGKTQILTLRIANILLKTQVNPENILALTFSESAAFEMRQRLAGIIGTLSYRVEISTFHSFANNIIKNYPDEFPKLINSENVTDVEIVEIIEKIIENSDLTILKPFGDPLYYLKDILGAIGDLKKEGVGPSEFAKALLLQKSDFEKIEDLYHEKGPYKGEMKGKYQTLKREIEKNEEFLKVFLSYQDILEKEKKYDYNDMLLETANVLEKNKSLLLRIQEKYQYFLIDEHQDTNASQNKLIQLLACFFETPNLFVVGDEKQAIYRFQGASIENFLFFKTLYPQAKLINLEKNYRSHQLILDAAGSLIEKNISANILGNQNLISTGGKIEKIYTACLSEYPLEYEFVADDILKKIKNGVSASEIAVLARRNTDLAEVAESLKRRGVPYSIFADDDIFSDYYIQKLIIILKAVSDFGSDASLVKALHVDFLGIEILDVYKILNFARKKDIDLYPFLVSFSKKTASNLELENRKKVEDFISVFKGWISLNENIPFEDLFIKIINESGMRESFLKSSTRFETLNRLISLFDEIKLRVLKNPEFNLKDFLTLVDTLKKHKMTLRAKTGAVQADGVRLLTVHKSKGLEFDYVYIINCFDGRWGGARKKAARIKLPWNYLGPDKKADIEFEEVEDERRLFYVGITRARKGVMLTFSKLGIDLREQLPSQFLQEIDEKLLEQIDTGLFEKNFDKEILIEDFTKIKISPKNKEYFSKLFSEKGLSVSGLENFLECPWKYFFRNLISLPDVKNKYLVFGTAIHEVLDFYIKKSKTRIIDSGELVNKFKEIITSQALSEVDKKELLLKGEKVIPSYYDNVARFWSKDIQSEIVIRGVKIDEDVLLNGRIDMIEPLASDGSVRVYDFKTGKPKSRAQIDGSKNGKYNYLRQLIFYKILLDNLKVGLFKMKEGVIDFVEPDSKGRQKSEIFIIEEKDKDELLKQIKVVVGQIKNLSFWDETCSDKNCEYCTLKRITFGE